MTKQDCKIYLTAPNSHSVIPQKSNRKTDMENVQDNELDDVNTSSIDIAGMAQGLLKRNLPDLRAMAGALGVENANRLKRENLVIRIVEHQSQGEGLEVRGGILEILNEGIGFLRSNYRIGADDVYVSQAQLRRYNLRDGDLVIGHVRPPREGEKHHGLIRAESINGQTPEEARYRPLSKN